MSDITELVNLHKIGTRPYVHSTTFIKFLVTKFSNISHILIKFSDIAVASNYIFVQGDELGERYKFCTHGHITTNSTKVKYGFVQQPMYDKPELADIDSGNIINLECDDMYSFIDTIVSHSKLLCTDLYDKETSTIYMASIELSNLSDISWPIKLEYDLHKYNSKFVVTYLNENYKIARLLGIVKNEKSME